MNINSWLTKPASQLLLIIINVFSLLPAQLELTAVVYLGSFYKKRKKMDEKKTPTALGTATGISTAVGCDGFQCAMR